MMRRLAVAGAALFALVGVVRPSAAQQPPTQQVPEQVPPVTPPAPIPPPPPQVVGEGVSSATKLSLEVGQDRLLDLNFPIRSMSIPHPQIADIKILSSNRQVLVSAKGVGDTYITLFDKSQQPLQLSVHVTKNLDALRKQLRELFPEEQVIVSSAGDLVILSGEVIDLRVPERMGEVAKLHAAKIANLIKVKGNQQVQLEVKFAEVSRAGLRQMGVNFFHNSADREVGMSHPNNAVASHTPAFSFPPTVAPNPINNAFSLWFSGLAQFPFSVMVSLLEENRLAKTLAEPTLVALTGQEAKFLAGGEFPIPVATGLGTVSIIWKKFGIQLKFLPTVLGDGVVNLHLESEVSELDPSLGTTVSGITVPGLTTRQSETTVRLRDGQSFAVAGLLSDRVRSQIGKIPILGEIPILGALFRSTNYRRDETELLVVVTARLAKPVAAHDAPLMPGEDELNDPDDFQLFLLGRTGVKPKHAPSRGEAIAVPGGAGGGPSGDLGFMR